MRRRTVLVIYGEGGHRAQMDRLYCRIKPGLERRNLLTVGICENNDALDGFKSFSQRHVRDKHSRFRSFITFPTSFGRSIFLVTQIVSRYQIVGVISTGPGIAVIPSILLGLMGARIVFLESWSRFETRSLTGRVMYRVAHRFYIQNRNLKKLYPNAVYGGLL